jgi:hypothetical protein
MPAILLPLGVAGLDAILFRRALLARQAGWIAMGLILGGGLYLLPFLLSHAERGDWLLLQLMWKENFVRGFKAFDHKDTVFYYFYILPAMFLPWSLFLPGALGWAGKQFKGHAGWRFALLAFALIFLFFTASESRRSYYILPVFPFGAILTAGFLADLVRLEKAGPPAGKTWRRLALVPVYILGVVLALGFLFLVIGPFLGGPDLLDTIGEVARAVPWGWGLTAGLALGLVLLGAGWRRRRLDWQIAAFALMALLMTGYFAVGLEPLKAAGLLEREFAREVQRKYPGAELVYYLEGNAASRFYLGPGIRIKSNAALLELLAGGRASVLVVCEGENLDALTAFQPVVCAELLRATTPGFAGVVKPETRYLLLKCARR